MRTSTAAALAPAMLPLATLTNGSKAVKQSRNRLRFYRTEKTVDCVQTPELASAVRALLDLGASVAVYALDNVWFPTVHGDTVAWNQGRPTSKTREGVTVQVSL